MGGVRRAAAWEVKSKHGGFRPAMGVRVIILRFQKAISQRCLSHFSVIDEQFREFGFGNRFRESGARKGNHRLSGPLVAVRLSGRRHKH